MKEIFYILLVFFSTIKFAGATSEQEMADLLVCDEGRTYRSLDLFELTEVKGLPLQVTNHGSLKYRMTFRSPRFSQKLESMFEEFPKKLRFVNAMPLPSDDPVSSLPSGCKVGIGLKIANIDGVKVYVTEEKIWNSLSKTDRFVITLRELLKELSLDGDSIALKDFSQYLVSEYDPNDSTIYESGRRAGIMMDYRTGSSRRGRILTFRRDQRVNLNEPCRVEFENGYIYDYCSLPKTDAPLYFVDEPLKSFSFVAPSNGPEIDLTKWGLEARVSKVYGSGKTLILSLTSPLSIKTNFLDLTCEGNLRIEGVGYGYFDEPIDLNSIEKIDCRLSPTSTNRILYQGQWRDVEPVDIHADDLQGSSKNLIAKIENGIVQNLGASFVRPELVEVLGNKVKVKSISRDYSSYMLSGENKWAIRGQDCLIGNTIRKNNERTIVLKFTENCPVEIQNQRILISKAIVDEKEKVYALTTRSALSLNLHSGEYPVKFTGNITLEDGKTFNSGNLYEKTRVRVGTFNKRLTWLPAGTPLRTYNQNGLVVENHEFLVTNPFRFYEHDSGEYISVVGTVSLYPDGAFRSGCLAKSYRLKVLEGIQESRKLLPKGTCVEHQGGGGYRIRNQ